jgi:hypothetical protein
MIRVLLLKLSSAQQGAIKVDHEFVHGRRLHCCCYVGSVAEKHVVTFQYGYIVKPNSCESIEAFKKQVRRTAL